MLIDAAKARSIADAIDAYDEDISALQEGKRDTFASLRVELEAEGLDRAAIKAEIAALKAAISIRAKRRKDDAAEEREALTETYLEALAGVARGARTREERSKDRLSEAMADNKELSAELVAAGLISPETHAENVAISDAVATKLGSGVAPEQPSGAEAGSAVGTGAPIPTRKPFVLRPHCQRPDDDDCGGYGAKHCGPCERAAASRDVEHA